MDMAFLYNRILYCEAFGCVKLRGIWRVFALCRYVLSKCERLTELSVDVGEGLQLDVDTLDAISTHCRDLQLLHLYGLQDQGLRRC